MVTCYSGKEFHMQNFIHIAEIIFFVFQAVILVFMLIHDWIPLGPFNDVKALQSLDPRSTMLFATVMNFGMAAIPFILSLTLLNNWIARLVIIAFYLLLFLGELQA